jgi:hypothetical protein
LAVVACADEADTGSPSRTYAALEILARSRDDDKAHNHTDAASKPFARRDPFAYGYPAHLRRDGMGRNRPLFSKKCHFALQSLPTCYGEPESVAPKWRIIYSPGPDGNPSD